MSGERSIPAMPILRGKAKYVVRFLAWADIYGYMQFRNGTELRFGRARYSQWLVRFLGVGGGLCILSKFIREPAKHWVEGIGTLGLIAGLVIFLSDTIAERKHWELQHKSK